MPNWCAASALASPWDPVGARERHLCHRRRLHRERDHVLRLEIVDVWDLPHARASVWHSIVSTERWFRTRRAPPHMVTPQAPGMASLTVLSVVVVSYELPG